MAQDPDEKEVHANDGAEHQQDIGGDGSSDKPAKDGNGYHHTVWSDGGHRFSWETDKDGNYKEDSAHENKNR